jgi:hypothetical protein
LPENTLPKNFLIIDGLPRGKQIERRTTVRPLEFGFAAMANYITGVTGPVVPANSTISRASRV